jgi:ABC-type Na+ efflux pump permease subunit
VNRAIATIARYVLVEARRSSLPWLAAGGMLGVLVLAGFLSKVAITEAASLQTSAGAAFLRACAMFLVAAHVVSSVVREANDKGLELALALPISRPAWYLGKLLGFAAAGALIAALFALPLLAWSKPVDLAAWWLTLTIEAALVAAAALFFASALGQTVSAITATAGLYLLARSMTAIQAIAGSPLASDSAGGQAARWVLDAFALLLPRLDEVARGDWLVYGAPSGAELAAAIAGMVIYLVLLAAAGLFDFSRRNL